MFYDPEKSHRGAKLCVVKKARKKDDVQFVAAQKIITREFELRAIYLCTTKFPAFQCQCQWKVMPFKDLGRFVYCRTRFFSGRSVSFKIIKE